METMKERIYRYILYFLLCASLVGILMIIHFGIRLQTPDQYRITPGKLERISFQVPVTATIHAVNDQRVIKNADSSNLGESKMSHDTDVSTAMGSNGIRTLCSDECIKTALSDTVYFVAGDSPYYVMDVQLFGFLPLKQIKLETTKSKSVLISGKPIGIYVKTMGVMVIDTGSFVGQSGDMENPSHNKLMGSDYILRVNGKQASSKKQIIKKIEGCDGEDIVFTIIRNGEVSDVVISPKKNDQGIYKAGIWIRDSAQGIGTLTYITKDGKFGALGHGINDYDTGKLMTIERGSIYDTDILSITKADDNVPGQITGVLTLDDRDYIGKIEDNTSIGIYGMLDEACLSNTDITNSLKEYEIAHKQEIKKGKAQICSDVTGEVKRYDVEILDIYYNDLKQNQGILFKVVDDELLEYTGGIVQGMSGSPILQDGKLIGAVTHVFVNDSTKGYGIFIENMIG